MREMESVSGQGPASKFIHLLLNKKCFEESIRPVFWSSLLSESLFPYGDFMEVASFFYRVQSAFYLFSFGFLFLVSANLDFLFTFSAWLCLASWFFKSWSFFKGLYIQKWVFLLGGLKCGTQYCWPWELGQILKKENTDKSQEFIN